MGFLGRIVRFLFWVLILSWVVKLLGRAMSNPGRQAQPDGAGAGVNDQAALPGKHLVKDPVCGMHVAQELALPATANGETQYFCSEDCRSKFVNGVLRRAANA